MCMRLVTIFISRADMFMFHAPRGKCERGNVRMSMQRSGEYVENVQNAENVQDWAEVKGPRGA